MLGVYIVYLLVCVNFTISIELFTFLSVTGHIMSSVQLRRPDSADDRHVMAKHSEIYPKDEELNAIQKIVSNSEKALKMVSDDIAEADAPKTKEDGTAAENKDE